jgi:hypothetical protein
MEGLVSFEEAAGRLGVAETQLEELIDSGALTTHRYMGDVFLLEIEVAAREAHARESAPQQAEPKAPIPVDAKVRRIQGLLAAGVREVRAGEVAELLQLSASRISKLENEGRVNFDVRNGRWWYVLEDIETYARLQGLWASKSGRWTPYGRQDAKEPDGDLVKLAPALNRNVPSPVEVTDEDDYRVSSREAARILAVSLSTLQYLVKSGQLRGELGKRRAAHDDARGYPIIRRAYRFSAREVYALADRRDQKKSMEGIRPAVWRDQMVKPFIRTRLEAPPGGRLLSRQEAAYFLCVPVQRISWLVGRGRLFGWQEHPGKHGCPLYVSERQFVRYASSEERLKRRAARPGSGRHAPSPLGQETEHDIWLEDNGMAEGVLLSVRSNLDRQHGEFLNTVQAAALLGVSRCAVTGLRKRGRLTGYQRKRVKRDGGGPKWWFYRRADVDELPANRDYLSRRARGRAAMQTYLVRY